MGSLFKARLLRRTTTASRSGAALADIPPNLDTVRGLACLLVVALHVVGEDAATGLHLAMSSPWHYAMVSLEFIRMPLFTALSGYLYAGDRVTPATFQAFWAGKWRRIGVPLVCVTIIVWMLRHLYYGETISIVHALLFSYGHLWYLQALILLFLAVSVFDTVVRPSRLHCVLAGFAASMLAQSVLSLPDTFSFGGAVYLAPYFLFGMVLRQSDGLLHDRDTGVLAFGVLIVVLAAQQYGMSGLGHELSQMQLPAALAGMAAVVVLLQRCPQIAGLAVVGRYSYTIYLWHVVIGAMARQALVKLGVSSNVELFTLIMSAAVLGPLLLHRIASRFPALCVMLTGTRGLPRPPQRKDPQSYPVAFSAPALALQRGQ